MPVGTAQFGQAYLSKTVTQTEAPKTQLGRAVVSRALIDHVRFISFPVFLFHLMLVGTIQFGEASLYKTESHTDSQITQLGAAASGLIIVRVWFVSFYFFVYADASRCRATARCSVCFVSRVFFQQIFFFLRSQFGQYPKRTHQRTHQD